jgi:hypothetical protein
VTGCPDRGEDGELARQAAQFPGHRLELITVRGRRRYYAWARSLDIRPSLVISRDLEEVCRVLAAYRGGTG